MRSRLLSILVLISLPAIAEEKKPFCPETTGDSADQIETWRKKLDGLRSQHRHTAEANQYIRPGIKAQDTFLKKFKREGVDFICQGKKAFARDFNKVSSERIKMAKAEQCGLMKEYEETFQKLEEGFVKHSEQADKKRQSILQSFDPEKAKNKTAIDTYTNDQSGPAAGEPLRAEWKRIWGEPSQHDGKWDESAFFPHLMRLLDNEFQLYREQVKGIQTNRVLVGAQLKNCASKGPSATPPGGPGTNTQRIGEQPSGPGKVTSHSGSSMVDGGTLLVVGGLAAAGGAAYYLLNNNRKEVENVHIHGSPPSASSTSGTAAASTTTGNGTVATPSGSKLALSGAPSAATVETKLAPITVSVVSPTGGKLDDSGTYVTVSCEGYHPCPIVGTLKAKTNAGKAVFDNLQFSGAAPGIHLTFSAPGFATAVSEPIQVGAASRE